MLTAKKKKFCHAWISCLNATQAAIKAGYSEKGAYQEGHRLLKNAEIQKYIEHIREELGLEPDIAQAEEVLRGYTRDIRFDPGKLFDAGGNPKDIKDLDEDTRAALAGFKFKERRVGDVITRTIEYRFPDKRASREALSKHMGWIAPDKRALANPDGNPMGGYAVIYLPDNGRRKLGGDD